MKMPGDHCNLSPAIDTHIQTAIPAKGLAAENEKAILRQYLFISRFKFRFLQKR